MPEVAVVTHCTPNHLNWHPTFSHYAASKQRILSGQTGRRGGRSQHGRQRGRRLERPGPRPHAAAAAAGRPAAAGRAGEHNRIDAACAAAAAAAIAMRAARRYATGLRSFRGLPQRLERVATVAGRRFYNDSAATTPESTSPPWMRLERPHWLLAGDGERGPISADGPRDSATGVSGVALFGPWPSRSAAASTAETRRLLCVAIETMADALAWCWKHSQPVDDRILLSPACCQSGSVLQLPSARRAFDALVGRLAAVDARPLDKMARVL